jgi:hypothetical protein
MVKVTIMPNLFQVPLTLSNRVRAEDFANQQSTRQKMQQVYQNTLAVSAVNTYLQCLGWVTSLETSDSWNPLMQALLDTADLAIPGYGKLECRVIFSPEQMMVIPEEVSSERIAYLAVSIDRSQKLARLLGFVTKISSSTIPIDYLQSMAEFPKYLEQIKLKSVLPKLSNWLSGIVEAGWNNIDSLLTLQPELVRQIAFSQSQLCFRMGILPTSLISEELATEVLDTGVSRVKLWDLGTRENYSKIALVISLLPSETEELEISVKICPTNDRTYLPEGLVIKILDETQQAILQAQTKTTNENVEFFLSGKTGEYFSIQAIFNDEMKMESFII